MSRIKVLCIGNALVADDAFGPKIFEHFRKADVPRNNDVTFHLLGVGGLDLLSEFEGEDVAIVVDAVNTGGLPGTLTILPWQKIETVAGTPVTSHDISLDEVIKIGRKLHPEQMPREVLFIGVEGKDFTGIGQPLSAEVQCAIPEAVKAIEKIITRDFPQNG